MITPGPRVTKTPLYKRTKSPLTGVIAIEPATGINQSVLNWLSGTLTVREHSPTAAFDGLRGAYVKGRDALIATGLSRREAHMTMLSTLTDLMLGLDLRADLAARLDAATLNEGGFRTALSQGMAQNVARTSRT